MFLVFLVVDTSHCQLTCEELRAEFGTQGIFPLGVLIGVHVLSYELGTLSEAWVNELIIPTGNIYYNVTSILYGGYPQKVRSWFKSCVYPHENERLVQNGGYTHKSTRGVLVVTLMRVGFPDVRGWLKMVITLIKMRDWFKNNGSPGENEWLV